MAKGKKQEDPNKVAQRKQARVEFVKSNPELTPEIARQRFYVQTRAAELASAGKDVDRAALREKFQTGQVTREGFYTPADVTRFSAARNTDSLGDSKSTTVTPPASTTSPTTSKPSTVKTPSTSYQAPAQTTSLGNVVQRPNAQQRGEGMGPASRSTSATTGQRANAQMRGEGMGPAPKSSFVFGGEPRPPVWSESGQPVVGNITRPKPIDARDQSLIARLENPTRPINAASLAQQKEKSIRRQIVARSPAGKTKLDRIDRFGGLENYQESRYDWTNAYKATAGAAVLGAEYLGTRGGGILGGALATGATYNITNRIGNELEKSEYFGGDTPGSQFKGDTTFRGAATIGGISLGAGLVVKGVAKVVPKIPAAWKAIQKWADDTPPVQRAPWQEGGTASPGFATRPATKAPWKDGPATTGVVAPKRTPKVTPEATAPSAPKITSETVTDSGLVIPGSSQRTRQPLSLAEEKSKTVFDQDAFEANLNIRIEDNTIPKTVEPAPVVDTTPTVEAKGKGRGKGKGKKDPMTVDLPRANKVPEFDSSMEDFSTDQRYFADSGDPYAKKGKKKNTVIEDKEIEIETPAPSQGLTLVEGNPRAEMMRSHPAFGKAEEPPSLSVFKSDLLEYSTEPPTYPAGVQTARELNIQANLPKIDEMKVNPRTWDEGRTLDLGEGSIDNPIETKLVNEIGPSAKKPPSQRANETDAQYQKRLNVFMTENEGGVFKIDTPMDGPRLQGKERSMARFENIATRSGRSVRVPDVEPKKSPFQLEQERLDRVAYQATPLERAQEERAFGANLQAAKAAENQSYMAEGNRRLMTSRRDLFIDDMSGQEPPSISDFKASGGEVIPPRPPGLKKNAAYDPATGEWRNQRLDKKTGELVFENKRNIAATPEQKEASIRAKREAQNAKRRAATVAKNEAKIGNLEETRQNTSNVEYGPFVSQTGDVYRFKSALPSFAQKNIPSQARTSLTTPPGPKAEDAWLNKSMTPEDNAFFKELGDVQKRNAGRRVVRATRQPTRTEIAEYTRRFRAIKGGPDANPSILETDAQINLEKEIEQVLGTDAVQALKNIAIRGNTPPLTQNISGLSLAEIKSSGPVPGARISPQQLRPELPEASSNLREKASTFFNKEGLIKGRSGVARMRAWQRVQSSDWFKQLLEKEPTFAKGLLDKNRGIAQAAADKLSDQVSASAPKADVAGRWPFTAQIGKKEKTAAAREFAEEVAPDGLGAYGLRGTETVEGITPQQISQRSEVANTEASLQYRAGVTRNVIAEDTQAFNNLADAQSQGILAEYGVVDQTGLMQITQPQFRSGRRSLEAPLERDPRNMTLFEAKVGENTGSTTRSLRITDARTKIREDVRLQVESGQMTPEQGKALVNERSAELNTAFYNEPSSLAPSNPFADEFGTELPSGYRYETPESFGKVWQPGSFKNEFGDKVDGRWISVEEAAQNRAKAASAQNQRRALLDKERADFYSPRWLEVAKNRAIKSKSNPTIYPDTPMFDKLGEPLPFNIARQAKEEAERISQLESRVYGSLFESQPAKPKDPQNVVLNEGRMLVWEDGYFKVKGNLPANYPAGADLSTFNQSRKEVFAEEKESVSDILKDWMSGD